MGTKDNFLAEHLMGFKQKEIHFLNELKEGEISLAPQGQAFPGSGYIRVNGECVRFEPSYNIVQALEIAIKMEEKIGTKGFELRRGCVSGEWEAMFPLNKPGGWLVGEPCNNPSNAITSAAVRRLKHNERD